MFEIHEMLAVRFACLPEVFFGPKINCLSASSYTRHMCFNVSFLSTSYTIVHVLEACICFPHYECVKIWVTMSLFLDFNCLLHFLH